MLIPSFKGKFKLPSKMLPVVFLKVICQVVLATEPHTFISIFNDCSETPLFVLPSTVSSGDCADKINAEAERNAAKKMFSHNCISQQDEKT